MNVINFLKPAISLDSLLHLFEDWNVDRGADGNENGFNLKDYADFHLFANLYGLETALKCQSEALYWIGGLNFTNPVRFPNTHEAKEMIDKVIDIDTIIKRPDIYGKYFIMDDVYKEMYKDRYKPNYEQKKDLEYPVVLQHFTIVIWRMFADNIIMCFDVDMTEDEVMDMAANLAWDFTELYKRTSWETTFRDYMLHFIVLNLQLHSTKYFEKVFNKEGIWDRLIQSVINQGGYFCDNQ